MSANLVKSYLRAAINRMPNKHAREWAKENSLSTSYVSEVLAGRKEPGKRLLKPLGLERVVTYRKIKTA